MRTSGTLSLRSLRVVDRPCAPPPVSSASAAVARSDGCGSSRARSKSASSLSSCSRQRRQRFSYFGRELFVLDEGQIGKQRRDGASRFTHGQQPHDGDGQAMGRFLLNAFD